jgi:hypothetical protein
MPRPLLKLATGSHLFAEACGCCKVCILPITAPNIRQWCLNAGQHKSSSMEREMDFNLRAKQLPLATCCHPYAVG